MKYLTLLFISVCCSCKKDWLLLKQDKSLVVPTTIADMQAIMNDDAINYANSHIANISDIGTDVVFLTPPEYDIYGQYSGLRTARNAYSFARKIFEPKDGVEYYNSHYLKIFYANVALDGLSTLQPKPSETVAYNKAKGCALFARAYNLWWLSQVFAPPYDSTTAASPGIPVRLTSDINASTSRATVQEGYDRILADANAAIPLLPPQNPYKTQPSRATAYALIARTLLSMRNYAAALQYSDSSLQLASQLMDLNTLDLTQPNPISHDYSYSTEVLYSDVVTANLFSIYSSRVDTGYYASFADNDLRKQVFFKISDDDHYPAFVGSYEGSTYLFVGITTAEMFLVKAECLARSASPNEAMNVLNSLLISRWMTGTFTPYTASSPEEALGIVLNERKKDLCFRGLRWSDLRRLNLEPGHETTVVHQVRDSTFTLPPNSKLYELPFPQEVIDLAGISQNDR